MCFLGQSGVDGSEYSITPGLEKVFRAFRVFAASFLGKPAIGSAVRPLVVRPQAGNWLAEVVRLLFADASAEAATPSAKPFSLSILCSRRATRSLTPPAPEGSGSASF